MLISLLLMAALSFQATGESTTGIVAGHVEAPEGLVILDPIRIVLLSPRYATLWETDVQRRLDGYWEQYRQAFAQRREFFIEVSRMAHREALAYVLAQMNRQNLEGGPLLVQETSADGKFEFKNVAYGEYKVIATGRINNKEFVWADNLTIDSPVPQYLELRTVIP